MDKDFIKNCEFKRVEENVVDLTRKMHLIFQYLDIETVIRQESEGYKRVTLEKINRIQDK